MSAEEINWRALIVKNLIDRNRRESNSFNEIITQNNRLLDTTYELKSINLKLSVENEQLRTGSVAASNGTSAAATAKISQLESKLLTQQEQLTDLHRRKGENAQMIIDLNLKLEKQNKLLGERESSIADHIAVNTSLRAEVLMLTTSLQELKSLNSCLRDEHCALQLAFASLEEKLRKVQDENRQLVERLIKYKAKDAEKLNEENESFLKIGKSLFRKRSDKMRKELEDAAREGASRRSNSPVPAFPPELERTGSLSDLTGNAKAAGFFSDGIPKRIHLKFDAHDGEVNAVRWSPVEPLVATGGADRKVNLWDVGKAKMEPRGILIGSNAAVNSVEFDSTGTMVLATSNDYASRVWTVSDQRLRHTLTGHSGKVMAAKFLGEPSKVVTGSHDRTLKIWDLRSRACVETKFAGSSCNDLVTTGTDVSGTTIISGHYDKKIRFWDTRTDCSANEIVLQGKITSLDLSKDCQYLLSCVRDDTIKLLDLRMNQIIRSFSNDNFKVSCDWSRVSFSRDTSRIAAGSNDGAIFVWNINGQLEGTLKENSAAAVTAVSWNPFSSVLATVDRAKSCIIWTSA
ncbi:autophagy-related protein 16-1 isoform X3 [Sitodiplosis mosellana]|uniref:autophagy-related protein 16-1 isoform X3 n=1 Tax=Sitodiplosis mosellana TaxID=263140 RepID=UPI002444F777|nr:autophagy-related protein 16-1 isoform X3 [Sitodiplosis mosellana]